MATILNAVRALLGRSDYDTRIECGDRFFDVHRDIVGARSPVLAAEIDRGSLISGMQVIHHAVFDADTIERMIEFMYDQPYKTSNVHGEALLAHVRVHAAGDLYGLLDLKDLAQNTFKANADLISVGQLDTTAFLTVAQEAYKYAHPGYDGLKEEVWKMSMKHAKQLSEDDDFVVEMLATDALRELAWVFVRGLPAVANALMEHAREEHAANVSTLQTENNRLSTENQNLRQHLTAGNDRIQNLLMEVSGLRARQARDTENIATRIAQLEEYRVNNGRLQQRLVARDPDPHRLTMYDNIRRCRGCGRQPFRYRLVYIPTGSVWTARCTFCRTRHCPRHCRR